jgi:hypothetical protein
VQIATHSANQYNTSSKPIHFYYYTAHIIKPMRTRIYRKKYGHGSEKYGGTSKKKLNQTGATLLQA